jgi:hypothetical protein
LSVQVDIFVEGGFAQAAARIGTQLVQGENLASERLLALAVDRSPWDEGTLAGSGVVHEATTPDEGAAVSFDTPYAKRLHEHPEYNFSTDSNPNAQGKYLEGAALDNKDELGAIIAKQVADG